MEKTTRYNSSVWRRSSFLLLLLFPMAGFSQSDGNRVPTIKNTFSTAAIKSYQESSILKIEDFYHYLNLLSGAQANDLKLQLTENIVSLFDKNNTLVANMAAGSKDRIPLTDLLSKISLTPEMAFRVSDVRMLPIGNDFWFCTYQLEISREGEQITLPVTQKIFLQHIVKSFGGTSSGVWELSLGEMQ